jgi:hypothetical protein
MNIRQELSLAMKLQIPVPDFKVVSTLEDAQVIELLQTPGWEQRQDVLIYAPDINVMQYYYFDGEQLLHPLIGIDDQYLFAGKQGGKLDGNLFTLFPGELKIHNHTPLLAEYLKSIDHKGFLSITFSIFKDGLYYNDITLGIMDDFLQNALNLYNQSFDWFMTDLANNTLPQPKGISVSARLYGNTYYHDNNFNLLYDFTVPGAYEITDCFAISYWQEKFHIKDAWAGLYRQISDPVYAHNGICYNTDGGYKARKVYDLLKKQKLIS